MRYVDPALEPVPAEINFSNIKGALNELLNSLDRKAKDDVYRGEVRVGTNIEKRVVIALKRKYLNKCGYCESFEHEPCVEHHRPIGLVTGGTVRNKGYYWLAYEWTNMVASCDTCNERPYKGTNYPVRTLPINSIPPILANGDYDYAQFRYSSAYNVRELPAILHPEYCLHPEQHFTFNLKGEIGHASVEGEHSIRVYGLDRITLNTKRYQIYKGLFNDLEILVRKRFREHNPWDEDRFKEGLEDLLFKLINRRTDDSMEFTLFTKYMLNHLEEFFIHPFPVPEIQKEIRDAFTEIIRIIT